MQPPHVHQLLALAYLGLAHDYSKTAWMGFEGPAYNWRERGRIDGALYLRHELDPSGRPTIAAGTGDPTGREALHFSMLMARRIYSQTDDLSLMVRF
jgi:hypothetical protein